MANSNDKSKLNQLWDDLKTNLPEINFDDDVDSTEVNLTSSKYLDVDSIDLFDEDDGDVNDNDEEDTNNPEWNECEKNFEKYLKKDQHSKFLNENDDFKEQESLRNPSWPVSKSNDQAASITKYMFETTNPKLSMGIFESINLDDLLESVGSKKEDNDKLNFFSYKPNQLPTASRLVNDENVLMKLAKMSQMITKDDELDLKTGAIISTNKTATDLKTEEKISKVTFDLIENELKMNDKQRNSDGSLSEGLIRNDLNKFLKQHNIRDGNLVATRRLDLRPSQQQQSKTPFVNSDKKKSADLLMQNILNTNDDEKYFRNMANKPIKFLNEDSDNDSSSSDNDESDDDSNEQNSKILWIERYRQQKMKNFK